MVQNLNYASRRPMAVWKMKDEGNQPQMPKARINLDEATTATDPILTLGTHLPMYFDPERLIDADNVRPNETEAEHDDRVKRLIKQIETDGQAMPIKVQAASDSAYKIVDGQGRADAIRFINNFRKSKGDPTLPPLTAWCVIDDAADPWLSSVKLNVQRKNYSDLQLSALIAEARERYGWQKKGGGKKLADLFGITEQYLVEYNKLHEAPADVKARLASGELSKSGALALLTAAPEPEDTGKRTKVVEKAKEIAVAAEAEKQAKTPKRPVKTMAEVDAKYHAQKKNAKSQADKPAKVVKVSEPAKPVKVEAKHVAEAARQVAAEAGEETPVVKRSLSELLAVVSNLQETAAAVEAPSVIQLAGAKFLAGLVAFRNGTMTVKQLSNRYTTLTSFEVKAAKK